MTRKDYELIAKAIRKATEALRLESAYPEAMADGVQFFAGYISGALQDENPSFDKDKFLAACSAK